MSIATVVTRGYGSFGSVNKLPTQGFSIDEPDIIENRDHSAFVEWRDKRTLQTSRDKRGLVMLRDKREVV